MPKNATNEELERGYKSIVYLHAMNNNQDAILACNNALAILKDPYKRFFYDTFGDDQIELLLNPVEGYIYSRFFTPANLVCLFLFIFCNIFNLVFSFYLLKIFKKNILRFSLMIVSPLFLIAVLLNSRKVLKAYKEHILIFYIGVWDSIGIALEILNIALFYDNAITRMVASIDIILIEVATVGFIYRSYKLVFEGWAEIIARGTRLFIALCFVLLRSEYSVWSITLSIMVLGIIYKSKAILILACCVAVYSFILVKSINPWISHLIVIGYAGAIFASLYLVYSNLKSNRPLSSFLRRNCLLLN